MTSNELYDLAGWVDEQLQRAEKSRKFAQKSAVIKSLRRLLNAVYDDVNAIGVER